MKIITILSDFGIKSGYAAQMKGVILNLTDCRIIDITHEIKPQDINEGAFVLMSTVSKFPIGTIHIAVVDPGVGSKRKGLIVVTRTQILIGPDNGLLIPAARYLGDFIVYEIKNDVFSSNLISDTFHGRDIFAPIAAKILNGVPFEELGNKTSDFFDLDFDLGLIESESAIGKVIYIDRFGNIITNIQGSQLKNIVNYDKKINILIGKKSYEILFVKSYSFVKKRHLMSTIGSSDLFEISVNQGNAAKRLNIKIEDEIKILFE
jgi:S-adenosylmethionine hydrolase